MRRIYKLDNCDDCGWHKRVTPIRFWLNNYRMLVCAQCIRPYRKRILSA